MKKQFLILFAFISVLAFGQVPQRFNKVVVTGDITSPKFIKTGSNADSVLLGNGSARAISTIKTDTVGLSNRINAKATGTGTANGTNTGDETLTSIKTKLGAATAVSDGYLKYQDWSIFNSKEPAITKNTGFNKNFGTTPGTVLEGRTFGTAANSAVGDFQPSITGLTTNSIPKWNGSNFVNATAGTDYQLPITLTTNGTSGAATFENGVMNVPNYSSSGGVDQTQTTVNGSTSGSMLCSMPFQTGSYKKVIIYLTNLVGTAEYVFPVQFVGGASKRIITTNVTVGTSGSFPDDRINITATSGNGTITIEGY